MLRGLFTNTLVSVTAFAATTGVPLLLIPLIVGRYGIAEYGLIALARILLPTGSLAIFDFGNSEIATRAVTLARHDGDWARAGRQLFGIICIAMVSGLIVSTFLAVLAPFITTLFRVAPEGRAGFQQIILVTSAAFTMLLVSAIAEGIVKGFEAFKRLRTADVCSSVVYAAAAATALSAGAGFEWIAFAFVGALLLRALAVALIAVVLLRSKGLHLRSPDRETWSDVVRRARLMAGNRVLSAAQTQLAPLLIGALLGSAAVGIYDVIIRFPRALKVGVGLLSSAVLPVASRLDARGDALGMRRLGEIGLLGVIAVATPICAWGAVFSEPLLTLWLDDSFARFGTWQALMFAMPLMSAVTSFGGGALLGRAHVIAQFNAIALAQIALQLGIGLGMMSMFGERAFLLGQILAMLLSFPFQLRLVVVQKQLPARALRRHLAIVLALGALTALCYLARAAEHVQSLLALFLSFVAWMAVSYLAMWLFTLLPDERAALLSFVHRGTKRAPAP